MNLFKGLSISVAAASMTAIAPSVAAAATAGAPGTSAGDAALPYVIALLILVVFVVGYVLVTTQRGGRAAAADENYEYDESADYEGDAVDSLDESAVYAEADDLEYDESDDDTAADYRQSAPMSAKTKRTLVTVAIVVAFILVGVVVGSNATKPQVSSGQIVQTFDGGAPCATVVVPVDAEAAGGPEKAAEALFAALGTAQGINDASFDIASSQLTVGYCSTTTNEGAVRGVLGTTGIVTQ